MEMLGNKIKSLRINKNITQEELAEKLSITSQAVSKWERNISSPDISMLPMIARYFGITIDELLNYKLEALTYKERFIRFMYDNGALRFGEYKLSNGIISPYEILTERYSSGSQISKIGEFYADCIRDSNVKTDLLFVNTYKESHIITAVSLFLFQKYGIDIKICIENKSGSVLTSGDEITVLKDTIATGNTLRWIIESVKSDIGKYPSSIILSVDRAEKDCGSELTSRHALEKEYGVKIYSIVNVDDIISAVENGVIPGTEYLDDLKEYRKMNRGI